MNNFLQKSSERFEKELKRKEFLINPISKLDAEIVAELIELLKKYQHLDIVEILGKYKYLKDEEIRDMLMQLNIDFHQEKKSDQQEIQENYKDGVNPYFMFQFTDMDSTRIKIIHILGYKKIITIHPVFKKEFPCILINECDENATKKPMYENTYLFYLSIGERNLDYEKLDLMI